MLVSRQNGWTVDTSTKTLAWPGFADAAAPMPDASLGALVYFGLGYLESQAAARTVNDTFRKAWLEEARKTAPDTKASEVPKSAVPASDSDEYRAELRKAHEALFAKLLSGYEVGVREGTGDPVGDEVAKLGAQWLQEFATAKGWYVLPPKRKVAKDDDAYADPKGRYATFGEALEAFVASVASSHHFAMEDAAGKPWPIKTVKGVSLRDLLVREATRRVAERAKAKPAVTLGESGEVDF